MNLEHNKEVQLMAPLQMWGRHRGVGLGAEEGHQDGPEIQRVPGTATEKTVPGSASEAWGHAEAPGLGGGLPAQQMLMNWARAGTGVGTRVR